MNQYELSQLRRILLRKDSEDFELFVTVEAGKPMKIKVFDWWFQRGVEFNIMELLEVFSDKSSSRI